MTDMGMGPNMYQIRIWSTVNSVGLHDILSFSGSLPVKVKAQPGNFIDSDAVEILITHGDIGGDKLRRDKPVWRIGYVARNEPKKIDLASKLRDTGPVDGILIKCSDPAWPHCDVVLIID